MNLNRCAGTVLTGVFLVALCPVSHAAKESADGGSAGRARLIVTARPRGSRPAPALQQNDVTVLVKDHPAEVTEWTPLQGANSGMQLVFLFDESAPDYLALQIPSIRKFIEALPPSAEVAVAYMSNGRAVMAQTLTADHALAAKSLRLTNGIPGISASPYFCVSDLAKHWPSQANTRRVVFMVTNGEDPYYQGRDLEDPYVRAAIRDSQKAGLLVYSIYFRDRGTAGGGSLSTLYGQSYLLKLATRTGGEAYNETMMSPVSFDPYLEQFKASLDSQYRVTVAARGSGLEQVKVKSKAHGVKLAGPSAAMVGP